MQSNQCVEPEGLKPCPFCGGREIYVGPILHDTAAAMCRSCKATTPVRMADDPEHEMYQQYEEVESFEFDFEKAQATVWAWLNREARNVWNRRV